MLLTSFQESKKLKRKKLWMNSNRQKKPHSSPRRDLTKTKKQACFLIIQLKDNLLILGLLKQLLQTKDYSQISQHLKVDLEILLVSQIQILSKTNLQLALVSKKWIIFSKSKDSQL